MANPTPPRIHGVGGEGRRIMRCSDDDEAIAARHIVDAVGNRYPIGIARKVVHIDVDRRLAPLATLILEQPHQLSLLRINADDRLPSLCERVLSLLMFENCLFRSGDDLRVNRFRLNRSRYFAPRSILHALVWLIRRMRESVRVDFRVHFTADVGSPAVAPSITSSMRCVRSGLFFRAASDRRPADAHAPPGSDRSRPVPVGPARWSCDSSRWCPCGAGA